MSTLKNSFRKNNTERVADPNHRKTSIIYYETTEFVPYNCCHKTSYPQEYFSEVD